MDYNVTYSLNGEYIRASVYCDDDRATPSIGLKAKSLDKLPRDTQRVLDRIKIQVDEYISNCKRGNKTITAKDVTDVILIAAGKKKKKNKLHTVGDVSREFLEGAKTGAILTSRDKRYSKNSIRGIYYSIRATELTGIDKVKIDELQPRHFEELRAKLSNMNNSKGKGFTANAIKSYNDQLVTIIMRTKTLGMHDVDIASQQGRIWATGEDVDYAIYYNNEELKHIYEQKFTRKSMERKRDVFVFGCYTCLRHSDYYLTDYTMAINNDILKLRHKKTGNMVDIPLHPIALMILQKYNYNLPKVTYSNLNESVKDIARLSGMGTPTLFSRTEKGVVKDEYKAKWELTTTHTMRRSFATNAFIAMMPERLIMRIGGWKTYKSFERYLRLSGLDMAKLMKEQPFYNWNWQ